MAPSYTYGPAASTKAKPAKKKASKKTVGGFVDNFATGLYHAFTGIIPGVYMLGKAGIHDAGKAVGLAGGKYQLDNIGGAMWKDIEKRYSPLVKGNFASFGNQLYKDPASFTLDAATLFTGGAAGAGKLGASVAKNSTAGSRAALLGERAAGLERVSGRKLTVAERANKKRYTSLGGGNALVPKQVHLKGSAGATLHSIDLPRSAAGRARVMLRERVYAAAGERIPILHGLAVDKRGAKLGTAKADRMSKRRMQIETRATDKMVYKLPKKARTAAYFATMGFDTIDNLNQLVIAHKRSLSAASPVDKGRLRAAIARAEDPKMRKYIEDPSPEFTQAVNALHDAHEVHQRMRRENPDLVEDEISQGRRSVQPLEDVGLSAREGQRVGTFSFTERRKFSKEPRVTTKRLSDPPKNDPTGKPNTGSNFRNGKYKPDPLQITRRIRREIANAHVRTRVEALRTTKSTRFDPRVHAEGVVSGRLEKVAGSPELEAKMADISSFIAGGGLAELSRRPGGKAMVADYLKDIGKMMDDLGSENDLRVIPAASLEALRSELKVAEALKSSLLRVPTDLWRTFVLSLSGTFYANNFFGNLLLGLVAGGPGFAKELALSGSKRSKMGKRMREVLPDVERTGFAGSTAIEIGEHIRGKSKVNPANIINIVGDKVAREGAKFTEDNFRFARSSQLIKQRAKTLQKSLEVDGEKLTRTQAIDRLMNDAEAVDDIAETMYSDMLDYSKLTDFEKTRIRPLYPFWNFLRAMTGRTVRLTLDEPWKVQVMAALSNQAIDSNEDRFGMLPDYLQGMLPIGTTRGDKTKVLSTYGANPFSAPADVGLQIGSLISRKPTVVANNPLSGINPYIRSGVEAFTGKDVFLGSDLSRFGDKSRSQLYLEQLAGNFPVYAKYHKYQNPGLSPTVQRSRNEAFASYFGVPIGDLNMTNVRRNLAIQADAERRKKASQARARARAKAAKAAQKKAAA